VRVIELPVNQGKAVGLSEGCAAAVHPIVVLADARQRWDEDALRFLLEDFADPSVGAVSGELILESQPGVIAGVGLYWRYEKWIRKAESRLHSTAGLTGAICAVRRWLFRPVPAGTVLDDVYWPMRVVLQGSRVVFDGRAQAFDRLPSRPRDEFRRKVRTLAGNYQLVGLLPRSVVPWRNPIWWQFVSHKLLRLVVPWALIVALVSSFFLRGSVYRDAFWCQVGFYGLGVAGLSRWIGRGRVPAAAGSFLVLNAAAWMAFWVWLTGRTSRSWRKVAYESRPQEGVPASSDQLNVGV
jgi:biofilm PGA synthesis N-glycosyltransferase PgaC